MNICQKCYDDMHMVTENGNLKFVCDSHCGYEDDQWVKTLPKASARQHNHNEVEADHDPSST